jgi:hypothetical protein
MTHEEQIAVNTERLNRIEESIIPKLDRLGDSVVSMGVKMDDLMRAFNGGAGSWPACKAMREEIKNVKIVVEENNRMIEQAKGGAKMFMILAGATGGILGYVAGFLHK